MGKGQNGKSDLDRQLLAAVDQVNLADDFQGALAALVSEARRLLTCDGTSVMWLNGDELEVLANHGEPAPLLGLSLPVSQVGAARTALDGNRPAVVPDTAEDARWRRIPGEERVRAWLGVPLLLDDRAIGLLEWTALEPDRFGDKDVEMAANLAHYAAPILHRTQLLDDTRRRLRELLEPRPARPAQMQDVGAALQQITREALDSTGARHAFTFLREEEGLRLRCVAAAGPQQQELRKVILRGDGTFGGLTARRSADWNAAGPADGKVMAELGITNTLILPLRAGKEQVGMICVAEPQVGRSFDQGAIRLMTHLASQASLIVERAYQDRTVSDGYDYETVFQSSPLGLCVLTVTGDIQACNPALTGLLSRADRSLVGRNLSDFLATGDWRRLVHALEEVVFTGQRQQVDTRIQSAQGEQRYVRLTLAPAPSLASPPRKGHAAGQRPGEMGATLVAVLEDITSLKILEQERVEHLRELREKHQQLQDLDQLRTRFVSNVSHELRTPLAVIKLYATLARKGRPEKQIYYLQTIEQETHRLETMVENILDLTRIDRQTLRLHPELLAAEEIIAQVLEVYQETAEKRGIELKNHVQGSLPKLWADKNDLIQMLTNLVDNALKYTPRGGQVWVAAREAGPDSKSSPQARLPLIGPMLEIAVGDTGAGIPEDEQEHIFERFYRGRNNTPECTGTGLGLAIVQELIAQHGGRVALKSQVGQGSVFVLQFPLAQSIDASLRPG
ncbi:MAG: GAF domain-containing protein [Anaerolineae bacterium]|nr:GAF domain-containing protein [Anaerolineae bacterium]